MTIRSTVLPGGLTVLSDEMPTVESASVGVWVRAGARDERPEQNGIAHLLEHMAFKGTARRSPRAIAEEIEAVGGHLNAFTSREQTAYYARVLADDVPLAVDLLADILQHSTLDADELAREREVVVQEIGQAHDTPDDIVFDHFQAVAYPDQAMGRPVLGTAETVRAMDRDTVGAYLARHYRGTRMILAAAGRVEHDALVELAGAAFEALPPGEAGEIEPAIYKGGEAREARELEQLHLVLGFPGFAFEDEDYYALSVFSTLYGGGMSSRLFQEVREERGLAYSIYSFHSSYTDGGLFGVYAGTSGSDAEELLDVIARESATLAQTVS
ncbi:MAG: insulinase family protein, partial [Rhodospirillaceae bacterium]|nr:insulinase family protein [Rhodospirillaceae bacterium]